jgi:hypothetical protein
MIMMGENAMTHPHRYSLNRSAVLLRPTQALLDWLLKVSPEFGESLTLEEVQEDTDVYLIPDESITGAKQAIRYIEKHWKTLFEVLLEEWIVDESLWPEKRTLKLFREWFEPIYCGMVWDLARDPLEIEDWEAVAAEHMRVH